MKKSGLSLTNPIGHRLRLEMKRQGISSAELAKRAEVKTSFIYDIISGKSANPSTIKLARVADILGVSLSYLAGGPENIAAPSRSKTQQDYVTVPRIAVDASAGGGSVISEEKEGESYYFRKEWIRESLGAEPSGLRMLYVRGDSMEPTLCHNDIILVDTARKTPSPPGIFVLFDGYGLVAKHVEYAAGSKGQRLRIISDNPQYSTYERSADEAIIIGRVVWFAREI